MLQEMLAHVRKEVEVSQAKVKALKFLLQVAGCTRGDELSTLWIKRCAVGEGRLDATKGLKELAKIWMEAVDAAKCLNTKMNGFQKSIIKRFRLFVRILRRVMSGKIRRQKRSISSNYYRRKVKRGLRRRRVQSLRN